MKDTVVAVDSMHNNTSDFPVLIPKILSVAAGMTPKGSDPEVLLIAQSEACCAFISGRWPALKSELAVADEVRGLTLRGAVGGT